MGALSVTPTDDVVKENFPSPFFSALSQEKNNQRRVRVFITDSVVALGVVWGEFLEDFTSPAGSEVQQNISK